MPLERWWYTIPLRLRSLLRGGQADRELDAELRDHLERKTSEYLVRGMTAPAARRAALVALGGVEQVSENCRDARRVNWLRDLAQDLRFGFRVLRKSPGFTAVAVLTLALGVGANTAIFSFIDAVALRPLPVENPGELALFTWTARSQPAFHGQSGYGDCDYVRTQRDCAFSVPFFKTVSARAASFSGVAAFAGPLDMDFSGNGPAGIAGGEFVSGNFFSLLGVNAVIGRPLAPSDDSLSAPPAIVLSYGYWQRAFAGDRSAVGRTVRLNNSPFVIVGVADPRFTDLTPGKTSDFFLPLSFASTLKSEWWGNDDRIADAYTWWVIMVGRLRPGVSLAEAQAGATAIFRNEMIHGPERFSKEADDPSISLLPAAAGLNGERGSIAPTFYLLMAAVGLVLLIACANVAGLMLARSTARQKELALRLALGASRGRIMRQLLTESVLLAFAGGAAGVVVSLWAVDAIGALLSSGGDPFSFVVGLDWRVLAFTLGVTVVTGLLFGLAPALPGARVGLAPALKETASTLPAARTQKNRRWRAGDALVAAQAALSIVVLVGAGLLVRTLRNLHDLNPGFDTRNTLLFGINPAIAGYDDARTAGLYRDLQRRFAAIPGVISVSYSEDTLLSGGRSSDDFHLDGAPPMQDVSADTLGVGLDFFSTLRLPLLAGRSFTPADFAATAATIAAKKAAAERAVDALIPGRAGRPAPAPPPAATPPVPVIVNVAFAREFFSRRNPLGMHMGDAHGEGQPAGPDSGYVIVGIAADAKYARLRAGIEPTLYWPLVANSAHFELRAAANPLALAEVVRQIVLDRDSNLPLFDVRTETEQIEQSLFRERLTSRLSGAFALLALVLAGLGLYGLLSYEVARRTREIGIRVALGADPGAVARMVVRQGILVVGAGVAIGTVAGLALARFLASFLYGVRPYDLVSFAAAPLVLLAAAFAASYLPARRAVRVDPIAALRFE